MKGVNTKKIMSLAIIGSIIVVAIMIIGTIWTGRSASSGARKAV